MKSLNDSVNYYMGKLRGKSVDRLSVRNAYVAGWEDKELQQAVVTVMITEPSPTFTQLFDWSKHALITKGMECYANNDYTCRSPLSINELMVLYRESNVDKQPDVKPVDNKYHSVGSFILYVSKLCGVKEPVLYVCEGHSNHWGRSVEEVLKEFLQSKAK